MEEFPASVARPLTRPSSPHYSGSRIRPQRENRSSLEDKGRLVTAFLQPIFSRKLQNGYDYTAGLEEELDHVSAGEADYKSSRILVISKSL
jgi:hypothetical protein